MSTGTNKRLLVKDSSGRPSWTLTICVIVLAGTPVVIFLEIAYKAGLIPFLTQAWTMSIGAFIVRDTVKSPGFVDAIKNKLTGKKGGNDAGK